MTTKKLNWKTESNRVKHAFQDANLDTRVPELDDYIFTPNPGLRSALVRNDCGNDQVVRTPFFGERESSDVLSDWMTQLHSLQSDWPTLYEFECDLAKKVGPMSVMLPLVDRVTDIVHYYDGVLLPSEPVPESALEAVLKEWAPISGLLVKGPKNTVQEMELAKSSGTPYFTKKWRCTESTLKAAAACDMQGASYPKGYKYHTAILGWRGQEGGPNIQDVKQRVIWMFPYVVSIQELSVYQPLVKACQRFDLVSPWKGNEAVDEKITRLFDSKSPEDLVVCTDFTKFDQHFNRDCANAAKHILSKLLTSNAATENWLDNIFPIKYNIPLLCDGRNIIYGYHGMASGSGGTNADETILHRCLQHEAAINDGEELNLNSMCLGDDGILSYPGITVDSVVATYSAHGQEMNTSKQYASTKDCVFLRRWHHTDYRVDGICVGVYSTCRALGKLMYMERFKDPSVWSAQHAVLRALCILENVKYHPLRESFADYVLKGDKYRLGLDIPGFYDKFGYKKLARGSIDQVRDSMNYSDQEHQSDEEIVDGMDSWWIINYIKSKA